MVWEKVKITLDDGTTAYAQAPYIISVSRATDIPAFYMDWFLYRLQKGYSAWTNPFTNWETYISFVNLRMMVFWSKNPKPLLENLDKLADYNFYIQYTLNDYEAEGLEPGVPPLAERIDTFKQLVDKLGVGKVVWRFDPLILSDTLTVEKLLEKIKNIGDQLQGYTEKMVFSFIDITDYNKVKNNLFHKNMHAREFTTDEMLQFAEGLQTLNQDWHYELGSCCEKVSLENYGIKHNRCIDDDLIIRLFPEDNKLRKLLGIEILPPDMFSDVPQVIKTRRIKDKGQRQFCGCIVSKDIGEYNTCPHMCLYCYANESKEKIQANWQKYQADKSTHTITGK